MPVANAGRAFRNLLLLSLLLTVGCSQKAGLVDQPPVEPHPAMERQQLGFDTLMSANPTDLALVDNRYFVAGADAAAAHQPFIGTVEIPEVAMRTIPDTILPTVLVGKKTQLFPGTRVRFFSAGDHLVPIERHIMRVNDNNSFWQIQISPGRVWSEADDHGWSRASFPFLLTSDFGTESYNGVATFLYDGEDVSQLRYQLTQQTSPYLLESYFVAFNQVSFQYHSGGVDQLEVRRRDFSRELADRKPLRPWAALEDQYGSAVLDDFEGDIDPLKTITSGLMIDDVIYLKPVYTPYGDYPYPEEIRLGIWSVTKSMFGLVTMLRMAEKYGDGIFQLKIADYLEVSAEHEGWDEVTFGDALNMATGIGTGTDEVNPNMILNGYLEDTEPYNAWYLAPTQAEKLQYVFRNRNHPWGPGVHARYRDRDIFTLGAALLGLLQEKEGAQASLSDMMIEEVYRPIGIHHMSFTRTMEAPGQADLPHMGWGLYMSVDDIAKLSGLLQQGGRHQGEQILSAAKLREALYQTDKRGLPTGKSNLYGPQSYHMTLWHTPYRSASGREYSIPEMHGWGGMLVALMPNGITGFRLGNGGFRPHHTMVNAADKIRPFDNTE